MTTPEFKIANKTKPGGQVPLEKAIDADISTPASPKPSTELDEPEAPSAVNATQVPVEVTKSSNDTGSSHRKHKGNDMTERSKNGKDKGKDQLAFTDKKRKRSTPQAVESEDESSEDKSSHGTEFMVVRYPWVSGQLSGFASPCSEPSSESAFDVQYPWMSEQSCGFASPRSQPSWKLGLDTSELVMIKEKNSQQTSKGKEAELIIRKEEAICRFCFNIFVEDNVLKTKCTCKFTLIHEPCATEWSQKKGNNKCDVCEEDIQNIPVTLSEYSYQSSDTNKKDKPKSVFSQVFWQNLGCFGSQGS